MFLRDKSTMFLIILALGLIAGGVWYAQKPAPKTPPVGNKNDRVVNDTGNIQRDQNNQDNVIKETPSKFCSQDPIPLEIGRDEYPINIEKYGDIGFLGELFTAVDCGPERVSKIFGVEGDNYTLWPDIGLRAAPSKELLIVLQEIGFEKGSSCNNIKQTTCTHWTLYKTVPVDNILRLKNFTDEIQGGGCVNCG